jgi:hypothetical protein
VHASLVRRGRAVAYCSLGDIQTCRVLEVALWMFDVAACCKTRVAHPGFAATQSLVSGIGSRATAADSPEAQ